MSIHDIMSSDDFRQKRQEKTKARKLVAQIVNRNPVKIIFSRHALEEILKDNLTTVDVLNILKSPDARVNKEGEYESGSWRYRLETAKIVVVIAFVSATSLVVVTAWRK